MNIQINRQTAINEIGAGQAKQTFNADAYARMPDDERIEEGLGIALSQWAEWDGLKLMRVFRSALEDSNFHTEAAQVEEWIKEIEKD